MLVRLRKLLNLSDLVDYSVVHFVRLNPELVIMVILNNTLRVVNCFYCF